MSDLIPKPEGLAKALNINLDMSVPDAPKEIVPIQPEKLEEEKQYALDFEETRKNIKQLTNTSEAAIAALLPMAESSENPRYFEVLADMIRTTLEANKALLNIHSDRAKQKKEGVPTQKNITNNTINVASTAEFLQLIRPRKDETDPNVK
jgi:hypothetical protein